jgi:hypothetical protein
VPSLCVSRVRKHVKLKRTWRSRVRKHVKLKNRKFVKELGGAIRHFEVSDPVKVLQNKGLLLGQIIDYGCGRGFDADHFGWDGYDPYYRQEKPTGEYDTIICNHVANILTRKSRHKMFESINGLLAEGGVAYIIVSRRIPEIGKMGLRKRIQNYIVLTLPSVHVAEGEYEIYKLNKDVEFTDKTREFEERLQ